MARTRKPKKSRTSPRPGTKAYATRQAYNREYNRIRTFIRRAENRGFLFDESTLPSRVKRPTEASIRRLQKLTSEELYNRARFVDVTNEGEIVSGQEGRKRRRQYFAKKAAQTRKANQQSAQDFWTSDTSPLRQGPEYGQGAAAGGVTVYRTFTEEFLSRLSYIPTQDIDNFYSGKKYRRAKYVTDRIIEAQDRLRDIVQIQVNEYGEEVVGWRIYDNSDVIDAAISGMYAASSAEVVTANFITIARILMNGTIPPTDNQILTRAMEMQEEW